MRDRLLGRLAALLSKHPRKVLTIAALTTLLCALALPGIPIKSGHSSMVARDDPDQRRFAGYLSHFGSPDVLFVLIDGGSAAQRRRAVDLLTADLSRRSLACRDPSCVRDVLGRVDLDKLRAYALQFLSLAQLRALHELARDEHVGIAALLTARDIGELVARLGDALDHRAARGVLTKATALRARRALSALRRLFVALDEHLAGKHVSLLPHATTSGLFGASQRAAASLDERGYLQARDGSFHLLLVRPRSSSDEPPVVLPFIDRVRAACTRALRAACPGGCSGVLHARWTGLPAIIAAESRAVGRDLRVTGLCAGVAVLLIFALGLRSLRQGLLGVVPLLAALVGALAFARLCFGQLNMLTSAFVATVVGVGVDCSIHLLARYNEARADELTAAAAARAAVRGAGPGIVTGALTSALAFLALTTSGLEAFAQLGAICAVGLVLALLATLTIVPALLSLPSARWLQRPPTPRRRVAADAAAAAVVRWRWPIVALGLSAALLLGLAGRSVPWSYDYLALLPRDEPSVAAMRRLAGASAFSAEVAVTTASSLAQARTLAARLRALPSIGRVESLADYLPPTNASDHALMRQRLRALARAALRLAAAPRRPAPRRVLRALQRLRDVIEDVRFDAGRGGRATLATGLSEWLPVVRRIELRLQPPVSAQVAQRLAQASHRLTDALQRAARWLAEPRRTLDARRAAALLPSALSGRLRARGAFALYIYPRGSLWRPGFLARFVGELQRVDTNVTGFPILHYSIARAVERDLLRILALLVAVVFVVLLVDLRRLLDTVLAVVPLTVGLCSTVGAMALLGLHYNFASILGFPLIVGIGVDSAVHLLHRAAQQQHTPDATRSALARTGGAVVLSALTSMAGFGALALASHRGAASLGVVLLVGISASLLASLLLLPALLAVRARRR